MNHFQCCSMTDRACKRLRKGLSLLLLVALLPLFAYAQGGASSPQLQTLTGSVFDENKEPVVGANVRVKETNKGTATDETGRFSLEAPAGSTLLVTYLGYESYEQKVPTNAKPVFIDLKVNATTLREAVVQVGYGGVKRANLLGSVVSLKAREVEDLVTGNLATSLQGRLAGVQIDQASGAPGASTSIQIRIDGSWNDEPPLFVIDGFVRDQAAFDILDPTEIEDISVLKDAAAAVYGARSAGGVILVKTKRGKEGKAKIS
ncbi:MAG: TonB-dependent receptor plug domain-containing protein, partial [Bacteroidales bacterium]|nr:TonB-dependent receptor plug domain-containing protein [Bacteroidales bacterium]